MSRMPSGLHGRVMARLEAEGLVAPPARWPARLGVAAALLLATAAGAVAGHSMRRPVTRTVTIERPIERIVERPVVRTVERPVVRTIERRVEVPVERIVERTVVRTVERRVEVPFERIVTRVQRVEAPVEHPGPRIELQRAVGIERWSPRDRGWLPLSAPATLLPGTLLRSTGHGLIAAGTRRLRLAAGMYLVSPEALPEPLPGAEPPAATSDDLPPGRLIPRLVRQRGSGTPRERLQAQERLARLWRRLGPPGLDGRALLVGLAAARGSRAPEGPPVTAHGWSEWARRIGARQ